MAGLVGIGAGAGRTSRAGADSKHRTWPAARHLHYSTTAASERATEKDCRLTFSTNCLHRNTPAPLLPPLLNFSIQVIPASGPCPHPARQAILPSAADRPQLLSMVLPVLSVALSISLGVCGGLVLAMLLRSLPHVAHTGGAAAGTAGGGAAAAAASNAFKSVGRWMRVLGGARWRWLWRWRGAAARATPRSGRAGEGRVLVWEVGV